MLSPPTLEHAGAYGSTDEEEGIVRGDIWANFQEQVREDMHGFALPDADLHAMDFPQNWNQQLEEPRGDFTRETIQTQSFAGLDSLGGDLPQPCREREQFLLITGPMVQETFDERRIQVTFRT